MASTFEAFLLAQANFQSNPPVFVGYQTVAQSLANNSFTAITFDTNEIDTYSGHSTVTNPSRYVAQVAGIYEISGLYAAAPNATGQRRALVSKNGAGAIVGSQTATNAAGASGTELATVTRQVQMAVGDYLEVWGWQNSGGALLTDVNGTSSCMMSIKWVHS